jgi:hypothetical protein
LGDFGEKGVHRGIVAVAFENHCERTGGTGGGFFKEVEDGIGNVVEVIIEKALGAVGRGDDILDERLGSNGGLGAVEVGGGRVYRGGAARRGGEMADFDSARADDCHHQEIMSVITEYFAEDLRRFIHGVPVYDASSARGSSSYC